MGWISRPTQPAPVLRCASSAAPSQTGPHVDEYVVDGDVRLVNGVQDGRCGARQIGHAAGTKIGIVERDLVDVPQEIEPLVVLPGRNLGKSSAECCWGDAAIAQGRSKADC